MTERMKILIGLRRCYERGDPKHELPNATEDCGADCIFVGSAARAHCSVEVVRWHASEKGET
jgi:hypothetical protein